jgi:hypothetical protein
MPANIPIATAGSKQPKHSRPVPANVRAAIARLIEGEGIVEAATAEGVIPHVLRRWLNRPDGWRFAKALRAERIKELALSNPEALRKVRDESDNGYAAVRAAVVIEEMAGERRVAGGPQVAVQVNAQTNVAPPQGYAYLPSDRPAPRTIEHEPPRERPEHPALVEHRRIDAQYRAEDAERRRREDEAMSPIFEPPFAID